MTRKYLAPGENAYTNFAATSGEVGDISGANIMALSGSDYSSTGQETINYPLNSIVIRKVNAVNGGLLAGAAFEVRQVSGDISGNSGTIIGRYTTDNSGVIVVTGLQPGAYIVAEVKAPANYMLSENSQQQAWLKSDGTSIVEVTFANIPYGSILVTKTDAQTGKPLANARFRVTDGSGAVADNSNGEFITDENGEFLVSNLKPGSYVITEIEAPANYAIDTTPQTVNVGIDGKTYKVSFKNQPAGTIVIRKMDSVSKEPLANAEFKVTTSGGNVVGNSNGIYKSDITGTITIPNLPKGSYIIQETKAPDGYILENQSQTIEIDYGKSYTLDFYNNKMSGLQIIKIDSTTKQPLKGVEFAVYVQSGELIGRYVTDANGVIIVDTLSPGWYKAVETKTLDGYLIDDNPKDFQITANQFVQLVFENAPMSSLIIRKVDADTREPLEGAEFTVKTADGSL
ncbi:MAG: SpaA isopeptide-forming pilin-related protein, partial [Oscillospiraceae bacterium]|nr:SpaA isopeptide-forming pilin-related protein [Oscillospiraceae bacterium]